MIKLRKGSQEARDFMARLRAMRGKKRPVPRMKKCPFCRIESDIVGGKCRSCGKGGYASNPLTRREASKVERRAKASMNLAKRMPPHSVSRGFFAGTATGRREVIQDFGPRRRKNPPLLVLGNPGRKRRRAVIRKRNPSMGDCPRGFPMRIWRDPQFQKELKVFRSRHGAHVPVKITPVKMPPGSPRFMTAYGHAPFAVYDAPKASKRGKFKHVFGKKGKNRPLLVSSVSRGPRWLGYAGGTFKAKTRWLYD